MTRRGQALVYRAPVHRREKGPTLGGHHGRKSGSDVYSQRDELGQCHAGDVDDVGAVELGHRRRFAGEGHQLLEVWPGHVPQVEGTDVGHAEFEHPPSPPSTSPPSPTRPRTSSSPATSSSGLTTTLSQPNGIAPPLRSPPTATATRSPTPPRSPATDPRTGPSTFRTTPSTRASTPCTNTSSSNDATSMKNSSNYGARPRTSSIEHRAPPHHRAAEHRTRTPAARPEAVAPTVGRTSHRSRAATSRDPGSNRHRASSYVARRTIHCWWTLVLMVRPVATWLSDGFRSVPRVGRTDLQSRRSPPGHCHRHVCESDRSSPALCSRFPRSARS